MFFHLPDHYDGSTPVTLTFTTSDGKTITRFALPEQDKKTHKATQPLHPGMNRFQWNLRYANAVVVPYRLTSRLDATLSRVHAVAVPRCRARGPIALVPGRLRCRPGSRRATSRRARRPGRRPVTGCPVAEGTTASTAARRSGVAWVVACGPDGHTAKISIL